MKKIVSMISALILIISGGLIFFFVSMNEDERIDNVILMIGDGMGPAYTTAYRYIADDPETPEMEQTIFDQHLVGMAATYSDDRIENITDSAAAATAMATGVRTYNGAISVDTSQNPLQTVLEFAKEKGKSTGIVTTSQINHATPAAFASHNRSRQDYNSIADAYFDELINDDHKIDVMLGGGTDYFIRKDRNLVEEFQASGYDYVSSREELLTSDHERILGLFAPVGLPIAIDRDETIPSLAEMTEIALEQLNKNNEGFFLMVEGSQIDWAGHANDAVSAMSEVEDFAQAVEVAIAFAEEHGNTQVVITADHSTGGLSVGRDGDYMFHAEVIKGIKRSPSFIAGEISSGRSVEEVFAEYVQYDYHPRDLRNVTEVADRNRAAVELALKEMFNKDAGIGFTTDGHTGEDVPVYAFGPRTNDFKGHLHLVDIGQYIFEYFE